jgi:hypothetical protein
MRHGNRRIDPLAQCRRLAAPYDVDAGQSRHNISASVESAHVVHLASKINRGADAATILWFAIAIVIIRPWARPLSAPTNNAERKAIPTGDASNIDARH